MCKLIATSQGEPGMKESEPMVLVVDDDHSVRKAIRRLIKSVGMKVETFETAKDFCHARGMKDQAALCSISECRV